MIGYHYIDYPPCCVLSWRPSRTHPRVTGNESLDEESIVFAANPEQLEY